MALLNRPVRGAETERAGRVSRETSSSWPGLGLAAVGVLVAWCVHRLVPDVPMLTASVVLGIAVAHLPGIREVVRGAARPGLSLAGRRLMRIGIVLLGLGLGLDQVLRLGWATVAMVAAVVAATFLGTLWLGRKLGLPGDQPLLIATGYSICGASAIGAVSQVSGSDEEDVAASVALVTLCGTLAIAVLPSSRARWGSRTRPSGAGSARASTTSARWSPPPRRRARERSARPSWSS